jgi:hypothetical protein
MLNEVRRKPEKPRMRKVEGWYECSGAGVSTLADKRNVAYRDWKACYEQQIKAKASA